MGNKEESRFNIQRMNDADDRSTTALGHMKHSSKGYLPLLSRSHAMLLLTKTLQQ
jgi:hypothetical protein